MIRRPTGPVVALSALTATTSFLTLLSWDGLSSDATTFLVPLFWVCVGVAAIGLGLRSVGAPRLLVPALQLLVLGVVLLHVWAPDAPVRGWIPTPAALQAAGDVLSRAVAESAKYPAPVPGVARNFPALLLGSGSLLVVAVDFLACTLRRPPLAGLPLLVAFTVPVAIVGGVSWLTFALAAVSFVLLLTADQAERLSGWSAPSGAETTGISDNQPHEVRLGTLWPGATRVGLAGVGLAVLAPMAIPTGQNLLQGSDGPGSGDGDGGMTLTNPFVDMKRDLTRGEDRPLVRVRTDDPSPAYLRYAVLTEFDGTAWRPGARSIPPSNEVRGVMPNPPGLSAGTPRTEHTSTIAVAPTYATKWLPTPYPASSIKIDQGDWRFDRDTLDVVGSDDSTDGAGLTYEVESLSLAPDSEQLVSAPPVPRTLYEANTELPSTTPQWLRDLADQVTDGSRSTFEKAVLLQNWFRRDGGFEYSLDQAPGNGLEQLERFLGTGPDSRRGYCEQFATAMAMMARSVGIPARVAVGFLRPDQQPDGSWVYSSHDSHAWPELYFQGAGWMRFEPTPAAASDPPQYTSGPVPAPPSFDLPSSGPSQDAADRVGQQARDQSTADSSSSSSEGSSWWPRVALVLLLLAVLLVVPRLVRTVVRRRRLGAVEPRQIAEGCWAEVRDTAVDLGLAWDPGTTLRRRARDLVPALGSDGTDGSAPPVTALERLVLLVERSRYSRAGLSASDAESVQETASTVIDALQAGATPAARRRATWRPRSLWIRRPALGNGSAKRAAKDPTLERMSV